MRRIGPLVLVVILVLAGVVASSWLSSVRHQRRATPAVPRMLPPNISQTAQEWVYRHSDANGTRVEVHAKDYRMVEDPDKLELTGMELRLFKPDGAQAVEERFSDNLFETEAKVAAALVHPLRHGFGVQWRGVLLVNDTQGPERTGLGLGGMPARL